MTLGNLLGIIVQPAMLTVYPAIQRRGTARYNPPDDPMSLVTAKDLAKAHGAQDIFAGVSLAIPHQARAALVGPNGVGKSTLLELLAGKERPDRGRIHRARSLRIGYLPQDASGPFPHAGAGGRSVWEFCLDPFADLQRRERVLARLEGEMADPNRAEDALATYGPLQEAFERDGGYTFATRVRQVLRGLGIGADLWDQSVGRLSGGERTRLWLARLLLEDPGLLLLDEPTNHLDIDAMEWLEAWLRDWPGAALIVSHDRYFLDHTVDTIWELSPGGIEIFPGNYRAFAQIRAARRLEQERLYEAQQDRIRRETDFIRRNIAGQKTRQAKGRRKRLERFLDEEAIELRKDVAGPRIRLDPSGRPGDKILETKDLVIAHPGTGRPLFTVPDLGLARGECVTVLGPNGAGKTSLLRTLLGESQPHAGSIAFGPSVRPAHLTQMEAELQAEQTVLASLQAVAPELADGPARSWLARFGLAEDVYKRVDALSGGERRRLALARMAQAGANLLVLDEPTNNLDLPAQEALQDALAAFPETILLVTHDRYLAGALATQVWMISPEESELEVFRGGLEAFLSARASRRIQDSDAGVARRPKPREDRRRKASQDAANLEAQVEAAELALAALGRELELAGEDVEAVARLGREYAEQEHALEGLIEAWTRAAQGDDPT